MPGELPMITLEKTDKASSHFAPLENGRIQSDHPDARRLVCRDAAGRAYIDRKINPGKAARFQARGFAGIHLAEVLDAEGRTLESRRFRLAARTEFWCNRGPYAHLANRIRDLMAQTATNRSLIINGKLYNMLISWGRDHVHCLKAQKYFMDDVKTGMEYWMEVQEDNGMLWDCIHPNPDYPGPTWFGEALGEGYFRYDDDMRYIVRRIPVEADVEFLYTEGIWHAWKASGDDDWMARQLPILDKALEYNTSDPARWSKKHQLVRRSFCQDSWDFAHPFYCDGDHRVINPGDPQFLFHGDNSGVYSSFRRLAEMHEHLGHDKRAKELRDQAEAFRDRANSKLWFDTHYGHMIPETLDEEEVYQAVGDERERMSLSTGYTINRKLPTHEMAVAILKEYQRRGKAKRKESFAEWWSMDPPYTREQWPTHGPPEGEYTNGAICPIVAGEIAKAAFDHGMEDYGADILDRLWDLSERDGGHMHQAYKRIGADHQPAEAKFRHVDMHDVVNRGLEQGAHDEVKAWIDEGENDMRNLPVGRRRFGIIEFDVIDPRKNEGRSVLLMDSQDDDLPGEMVVPVEGLTGRSLYFLHALAKNVPSHAVAGLYQVHYADGHVERIDIRKGHEIGLWWGVSDVADWRGRTGVDRSRCRVAWRGANGQWKNVGMYMFGWNNPRPDTPIVAITARAIAVPILLGAVSVSDQSVEFDVSIRSYGLPSEWSQGAVFYAVAEGLAGIEDTERAFRRVKVQPRWAATQADKSRVTLHYPASNGYVSYDCRIDRKKRRIRLDLTGSFDEAEIRVLLPTKARAKSVTVDRNEIAFEDRTLEGSRYAAFTLTDLPAGPIVITY
jgi:hypothetical protein